MTSPENDIVLPLLRTLVRVYRLARSPQSPTALLGRTCAEVHSGLDCVGVWAMLTGPEAEELLAQSKSWIASPVGGFAVFSSGFGPPCAPDIAELAVRLDLPECVQAAIAGGEIPIVRDPSSDCPDCLHRLTPPGTTLLVVPLRSESSVFGALGIGVKGPWTDTQGHLAATDLAELGETVAASLALACHPSKYRDPRGVISVTPLLSKA